MTEVKVLQHSTWKIAKYSVFRIHKKCTSQFLSILQVAGIFSLFLQAPDRELTKTRLRSKVIDQGFMSFY